MTSNILFIVADDLNSWVGHLGRHPDVDTPAIDALARRGTTFTRSYCSAPYCNASRMSVFTGCRPATTGIYKDQPFWEVEGRRTTFIEHLRRAGYACFGAGKVFHGTFNYAKATRDKELRADWRDSENRLDIWDGFVPNEFEPMPERRPLNGMFDYDDYDNLAPRNRLFDWGALPDEREAEMPDRKAVDAVRSFLARPTGEPFFCAAGLYKPHLPWYVPKRFFDRYPLADVSLPFVKSDDLDDVPEIARSWVSRDHDVVQAHGQWRNAVQGYMASISYCDALVGEVVTALDASPAADDTAIVLWGDNGFHLGEKLHWRKFVLWEEATRVPFIVVPPRRHAGHWTARVDAPVSLIDLFPTLFEICGLPPVKDVDGGSLAAMMQGTGVPARPAVTTWGPGNHSIRWGAWRYTRYRDGAAELYDHGSDPFEWNNLIDDPRFKDVASHLDRAVPVDA